MPAKPIKKKSGKDDFKSLAKRLECDEDKATFEKRLEKIAGAKITSPKSKKHK